MNVLRIGAEPARAPHDRRIRLHVDGVDLVDLARDAELESATRSNEAHLAGAYRPLEVWRVRDVARWLFGTDLTSSPSGGSWSVLLTCADCGEVGCWGLEGRIDVASDHVRWSDFRQPHRLHWRHGALSFRFDRGAYEDEVMRFLRALAD